MLWPLRFKTRPNGKGYSLVTDQGVTKAYITPVLKDKDMYKMWYVTKAGTGPTLMVGEEKVQGKRN